MPEPEKPHPKREQPEPDPQGDEVGDDRDDGEEQITKRNPRLPDDLVIDEVVDDER